eukprot:scaffold2032_cov122-Cylindrotheca_fusiformis.AAC.4
MECGYAALILHSSLAVVTILLDLLSQSFPSASTGSSLGSSWTLNLQTDALCSVAEAWQSDLYIINSINKYDLTVSDPAAWEILEERVPRYTL